MINKVLLYETDSFDPYYNLAVESALMDEVMGDELIVYLWQNDNTVVIGKHQNAYLDVNLTKLFEDGGILARRPTGGGAVFHDKGNLNFSFITSRENYNVRHDNEIIVGAVRRLGINAEVNGRNDMVVDNRKFSGNAYLKTLGQALHHGTILISADTERMQKYLNVREDKLIGKGVKSVKSRVVNLSDISNKMNIKYIKNAIIAEIKEKFDNFEVKDVENINRQNIEKYYKKYSNIAYILGDKVKLNNNKYKKFSWGYADVHFTLTEGHIDDIEIFSDSIFPDSIEMAKEELRGKSIFKNYNLSEVANDIFDLIKN